MIRPYGKLQDWKPMELLNRARYYYEQSPTPENLQTLQQVQAQYPDIRPMVRRDGHRTEESNTFLANYTLAVIPHLRYSCTSWHSHEHYELIYVYSGSCQHNLKSGGRVMERGDFCLLPPNLQHQIACFHDEDLIVNILIRKSAFTHTFQPLLRDLGLLSQFFSNTLFRKENGAALLVRCGDDPLVESMVLRMYEEYVSYSSFSQTILAGQLTQLLGEIMRGHCTDILRLSESRKQAGPVTAMLRYMEEHLCSVTLQELSEVFSYSPSRCSAIIKEGTGKPYSTVLREYRLQTAARLLLETEDSTMQIAERVGFYDSSHLHKVFLAAYGKTPAQYRADASE